MKDELAIFGGEKTILNPPTRHSFGEDEKAALMRMCDNALKSGNAPGYNGDEEKAFCSEFSEILTPAGETGYADAVNSGTNALYCAVKALSLPEGAEVIVPPITDPGGVMPAVLCGLTVVPADTKPDSFNVGIAGIKAAYSPRTKAIIVAHISGEPADIDEIAEFAREKKLALVEDCAQAHMATINGRPVGTFGDVASFSMMFGKSTFMGGQGGVVYTRNEELYWQIRRTADRGKPFGLPAGSTNCIPSLNFNADELHCALGRVQFPKAGEVGEKRRRAVDTLYREIADTPVLTPFPVDSNKTTVRWFLRMKFNPDCVSCTKEEFGSALIAEGVSLTNNYPALPLTYDWYPKTVKSGKIYTREDIPNAIKAVRDSLILYIHEGFEQSDISLLAKAIKKVYAYYKK